MPAAKMYRSTAGRVLVLLLSLTAGLGLTSCSNNGGGGSGDDRIAVEASAGAYIEESSRDEADPEVASNLTYTRVKISGNRAEVEATSSATGNRYEVTLRRSEGYWEGSDLLTDRAPR